MPKRLEFRPANRKAKLPLSRVVEDTERLWRRYHLTYDQAVEVAKHVRHRLELERPAKRRNVVDRLSQDESTQFITQAYRAGGQRGLLVKTLLFSGARVSEFVAIKFGDFYLEQSMLHIRKGKGRKERYVPILPELAQELQTHLGDRKVGHLFETRAARAYSPRRVQQLVKEIATAARITKRVYPHLLRGAATARGRNAARPGPEVPRAREARDHTDLRFELAPYDPGQLPAGAGLQLVRVPALLCPW